MSSLLWEKEVKRLESELAVLKNYASEREGEIEELRESLAEARREIEDLKSELAETRQTRDFWRNNNALNHGNAERSRGELAEARREIEELARSGNPTGKLANASIAHQLTEAKVELAALRARLALADKLEEALQDCLTTFDMDGSTKWAVTARAALRAFEESKP